MSTGTFLQRYKIVNKIGEGSFSEVLKCKDVRNGEYLAAKRLKKRFETIEEVFGCAEIIAMQKITRHPNILYMFEFHFDSLLGKVTLLFELMDMSLYDFMTTKKRCIPELRAKNYLYQILCGLFHLHKNGLFHRDIKPENILIKIPLDKDCHPSKCEVVKIADLGSIRGIYSKPPYTEYISTRWYRSPECLLTAGYYGAKMDIWATGCVFYEMLTFKPLFAGSNEVDQLARIHNVLGTPNSRLIAKFKLHKSINCEYFPKQNGTGLSPLIINLTCDGQNVLKLMITYDPEQRTNIKRLLEHKYFSCYRQSEDKYKRKRSSSVEPRPAKLGGDYHESCTTSLKSYTKNAYPKFNTTIERASQSDVITFKQNNTSSKNLCKLGVQENYKKSNRNISDTNKNIMKVVPRFQKQMPYLNNNKNINKKPPDMYSKTTSNISQITVKTKEPKIAHPQSKSFVLPRMTTKRLEPIPEVMAEEKFLPKRPRIIALDSKLKLAIKHKK